MEEETQTSLHAKIKTMVFIAKEDGKYYWFSGADQRVSAPFDDFESALIYRTYIYRNPRYFNPLERVCQLESVPREYWETEKENSKHATFPEYMEYFSVETKRTQ